MFGSVGWGEILVLAVVGLFVFGPDRLPNVVKDAASMLRNVRDTLTGARRQLKDQLGDDFPDIDPRMLNPKAFVRKHLLEDPDDDYTPPRRTPATASSNPSVTGSTPAAAPAGAVDTAPPPAAAPAQPAAPYDPDTT